MARRFGLAFAVMSVFVLGVTVMAADSNIGTWKMNLAKSKFNPDRRRRARR